MTDQGVIRVPVDPRQATKLSVTGRLPETCAPAFCPKFRVVSKGPKYRQKKKYRRKYRRRKFKKAVTFKDMGEYIRYHTYRRLKKPKKAVEISTQTAATPAPTPTSTTATNTEETPNLVIPKIKEEVTSPG